MGARATSVPTVTRTNLPNRPAPPPSAAAATVVSAAPVRQRLEATVVPETYVHTQSVAASTWTITHNLQRYPQVTLVNESSQTVLAPVTYVSANQVTVAFSEALAGRAFLS